MNRRDFTQATALTLGALPALALAQEPGFWTLLREGGCVLLMRHAQTVPGVGDPPNFEIGNCSTQRNLSDAGREQARKVHAAFLRERVKVDQVRSSAWCRCVDTAMLALSRTPCGRPSTRSSRRATVTPRRAPCSTRCRAGRRRATSRW